MLVEKVYSHNHYGSIIGAQKCYDTSGTEISYDDFEKTPKIYCIRRITESGAGNHHSCYINTYYLSKRALVAATAITIAIAGVLFSGYLLNR